MASTDPKTVFASLHHRVTGELLHLLDGFYSNIEDGLFELAYQGDDSQQRRRCFDLMREMRYRRGSLIQTFAKRLQRQGGDWFGGEDTSRDRQDLALIASRMSEKANAHFSPLLREIAERAADGAETGTRTIPVPIRPERVAFHFIASCQSLDFDKHSIEIVQTLFGRFVLDRMGSVYGDCNRRLMDAGYRTLEEAALLAKSSA
ncbi:MAG: DUF1631 family protein [Pseudomonadota bacterium]